MLSDAPRIVVDHHRLELRIDVDRLGARLAEAVARILDAAERHVRSGAIGRAVDRDETALVARDELLRAVQVRGVNGAGQSVRACRWRA